MNLREELSGAKLLESIAALEALSGGLEVREICTLAASEDLIRTYQIRNTHIESLHGGHWPRLSRSTREFVENLKKHVGKNGQLLMIGSKGSPGFLIYRIPEQEKVIGCMYVVPQSTHIA